MIPGTEPAMAPHPPHAMDELAMDAKIEHHAMLSGVCDLPKRGELETKINGPYAALVSADNQVSVPPEPAGYAFADRSRQFGSGVRGSADQRGPQHLVARTQEFGAIGGALCGVA